MGQRNVAVWGEIIGGWRKITGGAIDSLMEPLICIVYEDALQNKKKSDKTKSHVVLLLMRSIVPRPMCWMKLNQQPLEFNFKKETTRI